MASIVALAVIALVSLLVIRISATALMMTGLSWDIASFQSYSSFFGVGFTTKEAEMVVNHPVRRQIIRNLIIAGNLGVTSGLATLIASVVQDEKQVNPLVIVGSLAGSVVVIMLLFRIGWINRVINLIIQHALQKTGLVRAMDYEMLLRIQSGFCVSEIEILPETCLAGSMLKATRPAEWGVLIMAVTREGKVLEGLPGPRTIVQVGDVVTAYGREDDLKKVLLKDSPLSKGKW